MSKRERSTSLSRLSSVSNKPSLIPCPSFGFKRSKSSSNLQPPSSLKGRPTFGRSNSSNVLQVPARPTMPPRTNSGSYSRGRSPVVQTPISSRPSTIKTPLSALRSDRKMQVDIFANKIKPFLLEKDPKIENLCPPTVNTFIHSFNLLFKEIEPKVSITKENYQEKIILTLKMLKYPGTVPKSLLKTIGAVHSFPQIIILWSWLIDLIGDLKNSSAASTSTSDLIEEPSAMRPVLMGEVRYCCEISKINVDKLEEVMNSCASCTKINELPIKSLRKQYKELTEQLQKRTEEKLLHVQELEKHQVKTQQFQKSVAAFKEQLKQFQENLDKKRNVLQKKCKKIDAKIPAITEQVKSLKEKLESQPCSIQEKNNLVKEIGDLEQSIKLNKQRKQEYEDLIASHDYKFQELNEKLKTEMFKKNTDIKRLSVMKPEIAQLLMPEKGFLQEGITQQIEQLKVLKVNIMQKMHQENIEIDNEIKELLETNNSFSKDIEATKSLINNLKVKVDEFSGDEANKLKETLDNFEKICRDLQTELLVIKSEKNDLKPLVEELKCKQEENLNLNKQLVEMPEESIEFFYEIMMNSVAPSLKSYQKMYEKLEDSMTSLVLKQSEQLEEAFRMLHEANNE